MMHEPEKSDLSTVARKPANNTGRPEAESVEPRGRTEGNTGGPCTRRTLELNGDRFIFLPYRSRTFRLTVRGRFCAYRRLTNSAGEMMG